MKDYPHIAARLFNRPLAVEPGRLHAIVGALGAKLGLTLDGGEVEAAAAAAGTGADERPARSGQVAVIPILNGLVHRHGRLNADSGMIESYQRIGARIEAAARNSKVAGIILDIDSPGGEVDGLMGLAEVIGAARARKPIYAVANESAFSAAYWIASSAERIFIPTTGGAGSIGVIAVHVDQSEFDESMGLRYSTVTAGARKADFSPHAPLGKEALSTLQAECDRVHELFLDHVGAMRPKAKLADVRDASLFFGADAVRVGLADQIGGIEEAFVAMAEQLTSASGVGPAATVTSSPAAVTAPSAPAAIGAPVVDLAGAREAGAAEHAQRVAEISRLCRLAERPELLGELLEKKLTVQQASEALITARAERSDTSHAGVDHRSLAGPGAASDSASGSQLWRDAFVAAFGPRALEVSGKHFYDKKRA